MSPQEKGTPWTLLGRRKKKKRPGRAFTKQNKGGSLIICTDESRYSEILNTMRSDAKLPDLGADVRSTYQTSDVLIKDTEPTERSFGYPGP